MLSKQLEPLPYICTFLAFRTLCSGRPLVCISEENKTTQKTPTVSIFRLSTTRLAAATFVVDYVAVSAATREKSLVVHGTHTYIVPTPHEFLPGQQLEGISGQSMKFCPVSLEKPWKKL